MRKIELTQGYIAIVDNLDYDWLTRDFKWSVAERRSGPRAAQQLRKGSKGVCWHKATGKWLARIEKDGKQHYHGSFTEKEAGMRAYDMAAIEMFGKFACLNFPENKP